MLVKHLRRVRYLARRGRDIYENIPQLTNTTRQMKRDLRCVIQTRSTAVVASETDISWAETSILTILHIRAFSDGLDESGPGLGSIIFNENWQGSAARSPSQSEVRLGGIGSHRPQSWTDSRLPRGIAGIWGNVSALGGWYFVNESQRYFGYRTVNQRYP